MIIPCSGEAPVALVAGAASGVGAETVLRLRTAGWKVASFDVAPASADLAVAVDIADPGSVGRGIEEVRTNLSRVDAVVNCAGVFPSDSLPAHLVSRDSWERVVGVNLTGSFLLARASLPLLRETNGSIVFVASAANRSPTPGASAYVASKAGVIGLMRSLAVEYGRFGVRANAVSPGWIDTPMAAPVLEKKARRSQIEHGIPIGSVATASDIAAIIQFLLSAEARAITGTEIVADGGLGLTSNLREGEVSRLWERVEPEGSGLTDARV